MLLKLESSNPLINGKEGINVQRHVEGKWVGTRRNIGFFLILPKSGSAGLDVFTTLGFTLPTVGWDLQGMGPARK